jgi:cyclic-di-GMP-binding protein
MATLTPPPARELPFTDARGCKEWLNALPLTNIPQAQALVLEALRAMNEAGADGLERLKCLELMRDKIAFLQGGQRSRYFGKTLPLSVNDSNAWITGRGLLEEMEAGYRLCLAAAQSDGGEIGRLVALASQRIVRYIGAQMLFHAMVYRRFDPQLWTRLHREYLDAESAGIALERVKDSLEGEVGLSSVAETYAQMVLIQAAFLSEMTAPQMDFAEALLKLWATKVQILTQSPESNRGPLDSLVVDLAKPIGARPQPKGELQASQRVLDVELLSRSMRKRIQGLQNGEDVATLGLPAEASALDSLTELKRLHKLWCEGAAPRPGATAPSQPTAGLVFGLGEIHFFVGGGKPFEQPGKTREMTRQEKQDIEVFGRVREQTHSKMFAAEFNFTVEAWSLVDEMLGAVRALRPATASRGIAIGRLVGIRLGDTAPFYLGMVSELTHETDGRIIATITQFPGKAETVAVRAGDARNRANAQWAQGFRLPALEKMRIPASLIVPVGMGSRGRGVEVWNEGAKEFTVEDILHRGADFDRVTVF